MTRNEIAEVLAKDRVVEMLTENIAKRELDANLRDLCQMVYLLVLTYDEDKIIDLWENNQIRFFLARVIMTQLHSPRSQYYAIYRRFSARSEDITECRNLSGTTGI